MKIPKRVVEDVGLEPLYSSPGAVCYHYTTSSISGGMLSIRQYCLTYFFLILEKIKSQMLTIAIAMMTIARIMLTLYSEIVIARNRINTSAITVTSSMNLNIFLKSI